MRHLLLQEPRFPRLAGEPDSEQLERWRKRPLGEKAHPYLFVDARFEKARVDKRIVVSEGVLIVYGVNEDGYREILGVEVVADTESEATYQELFFRALKARRGLRGVRLVTSDDHPGLEAAISRHFQQGASWQQRCQFHYAKNLLSSWSAPKGARNWPKDRGRCSPAPPYRRPLIR